MKTVKYLVVLFARYRQQFLFITSMEIMLSFLVLECLRFFRGISLHYVQKQEPASGKKVYRQFKIPFRIKSLPFQHFSPARALKVGKFFLIFAFLASLMGCCFTDYFSYTICLFIYLFVSHLQHQTRLFNFIYLRICKVKQICLFKFS